jgi:hypothetical protein
MCGAGSAPYNGDVDDTRTTVTAPDSGPRFAVAGLFLEMLAAGDFGRLGGALDPDATLAALLPKGFREWRGAGEICAVFEGWFGDVDEFEVVDASVGQVGTALQLRWRVRVCGPRFGDGARLVEQQVYAETGPSGRIRGMRMLCSGYCAEHLDG